MKTLGILGGVGPHTTAKIYLSIIDLIKNNKKEKNPPIVIYNLPYPFIIEKEAIIQGIHSEKMIPYLIQGAKILEKSGANFGILPCNTLHKYITEIRTAVKIPFLSILDETVLVLKEKNFKTVGILSTQTTVNSKIYDDILYKNKINVLYPTKNEQEEINRTIIKLINQGTKVSSRKIENICLSLTKKGAETILLACTDLQLLSLNTKIPIIDTTEVLIKSSLREMSAKKK